MMTPYVVTRYYRAPEVILGMGYKENGMSLINYYFQSLRRSTLITFKLLQKNNSMFTNNDAGKLITCFFHLNCIFVNALWGN